MNNDMELTVAQSYVRDHYDGKMIVSASAGSGKTRVLIERILNIVKKNKNLERILTITFTNAAANQMKERLGERLFGAIQEDPALADEMNKLPFADVCTIDSFCTKICKKYFEQSGLDPAFTPAEEVDVSSFMGRAWETVADEYEDDPTYKELNRIYGRNEYLKKAIYNLYGFLQSVPDGDEWLSTKAQTLYLHPETCEEILVSAFSDTVQKLVKSIGEVPPELYAFPYIEERMGRLDLLQKCTSASSISKVMGEPYENTAFRVDLAKKGLEQYSQLVEKIKKINTLKWDYDFSEDGKIRAKDSVRYLECFIKVAQAFSKEYQKIKTNYNKPDFGDIEKAALRALSNPLVRKEVSDRYDYVCIDEYQDTNELQESIISLVTKENKFMVGDVKQSIYGFRHTEPEIFASTVDSDDVETRYLSQNFRTDERLIAGINAVFEILMDKRSGEEYKSNPMYSEKQVEDNGIPPITVNYFETAPSIAPVKGVYSVLKDVVRDEEENEEATFVADSVRSLIDGYSVDDGKGKRKITADDIAVICRTRSATYGAIIDKLKEYHIPVNAELGSEDTPKEIAVLIDFLRVVNNSKQEIPLCSVMLSLFGFNEQELAEHNKPSFYEGVKSCKDDKFVRFFSDLDRYRFLASYSTVYDLLKKVTVDTDYVLYVKNNYGKVQSDNVLRFLESLHDKPYANSVNKYLYYFDNYETEEREKINSSDKSVSVMTIHKSKGLEKPIVFLVDVDSGFNRSDVRGNVIKDKDYGLAIKTIDEDQKTYTGNVFFDALKVHVLNKENCEHIRLLYVAMTRAKNHLFITGHKSSYQNKSGDVDTANSLWALLKYAFESGNISFPSLSLNITTPADNTPEVSEPDPSVTELLNYTYPYLQATTTGVKYAVTGLSKTEEEDTPVLYREDNGYATDLGILYHKVLQNLSFNLCPDEVADEIDNLASVGVITEAERKLLDVSVFCKVLSLPVIRSTVAKTDGDKIKVYKEYPFMYRTSARSLGLADIDDEVLVQGIIDLLIVKGNKATIVDYKYSSLSEDQLVSKYGKQLSLYKTAVTEQGLEVEDTYIVSLKTGKEIRSE